MPPSVATNAGPIFSATYSNVPVFEFNVENNHVMRRRADDWINATHILKVADFDKPARTRILEREVQKGVHEKVQGGYGKYQGTWVPLHEGRLLAERNHVLDKLRPIFDFVPGDRSPPQAPKHTTAASNKPKIPKAAPIKRAPKPKPVPTVSQISEDQYDNISAQLNDDESQDNVTITSESMIDEDDIGMVQRAGQYSGSRKRKRGLDAANEWSKSDQEHRLYADALLDYFMLHDGDTPYLSINPPTPPEAFQVDRPIDTQGHTALHWAAAMGEVEIVKDLMRRGANVEARNVRGETPLIRAALFDNCYEKGTMPKMVHLFQDTIMMPDRFEGTVFHHVAYTAQSCHKTQRARHYLDVLLNKLAEITAPRDFAAFLNNQDKHGDTAFHIAARYSKRCMRAFQGAGVASDIPNHRNETVDQYLRARAGHHSKSHDPLASSSPLQPDSALPDRRELQSKSGKSFSFSANDLQTLTAQSFSESFGQVADKAHQYAQTVDAEVQEKESILSEITRLLQNRNNERHSIRQSTFAMVAIDDDDGEDPNLREELERLTREAEALEEQKQHSALHSLVRGEENRVVMLNRTNGVESDTELRRKIPVAMALSQEQSLRKDLTREVVLGRSDAGMTAKGEEYMRLIASAMGMREDGVQAVLPEILEELELAKSDGVCVGGLDGMIE